MLKESSKVMKRNVTTPMEPTLPAEIVDQFRSLMPQMLNHALIHLPNAPIDSTLLAQFVDHRLIKEGKPSALSLLEMNESTHPAFYALPFRDALIRFKSGGRSFPLSGYLLTEEGKSLLKRLHHQWVTDDAALILAAKAWLMRLTQLSAFEGIYHFDLYQKHDDGIHYLEELIIAHH